MANLVFRGCSLDGEDASIIEVGDCLPDSSPGLIRLHHVAFRRNSLDGASGLSFSSSACSSLEMIDVTFSDNTCGDQCFARLSLENDLRGLTLRRNKRVSEGRLSASLLSSPSGSSSSINRLRASSNELSVIHIVEGSLEIRGAEISKSSQSSLLLDRAQAIVVTNSTFDENFARLSGAAILSNFTNSLTVSNCNFTSNSAETGAAVASFGGNLTISSSSFRTNMATRDAGSVLVSNGMLELTSSIFQSNTASGNGGAIFLEATTASQISNVECVNNTAGNGGCLSALLLKELAIQRSILTKNVAENGGAIYCDSISDSNIVHTTLKKNVARNSGGGIFLIASPKTALVNCTLKKNVAATGGGLISQSSRDLIIRQSRFQGNQASLNGGGAAIYEMSSARIEEVTWSFNSAQLKGGGVSIEDSDIESFKSDYMDNSARIDGAGLWLQNGTATMTGDNYSRNSAETGGGAIATQTATINFKDCVASQNIGFFGGGVSVSDGVATMSNMTFLENSAIPDRGGGFACYQSNVTIVNSRFLSNTAYGSGGAMDVGLCSVTARNLIIDGNTCYRTGAGISASGGSVIDVYASTFQANAASDSGALAAQSGTMANLTECTIETNSASSAAGGLGVYTGSVLILKDSSASSNRASRFGGAFRVVDAELIAVNSTVRKNSAGVRGGCLNGSMSSTFRATNSSLTENKSELGGCLYIDRFSTASFEDSLLTDNTAVREGGVAFLEDAEVAANGSSFERNTAPLGGSIIMRNSSLQLRNSGFADHTATSSGGSIAAILKNSLTFFNTSFSNSSAHSGGGIWLSNSSLTAYGLEFTECEAVESGGGVRANLSSIFLCSTCTFVDNEAGKHGGAIAFDSSEPHSPALQLNNCTFSGNNANLGGVRMIQKQTIPESHHVIGAVHVATHRRRQSCTNPEDPCAFVALTGSRFSKNKAKTSGGAIFLKDPTVLRYSCSPKDTEVPPAIDATDVLKELDALESAKDICSEWSTNEAGLYGPNIASSARSARGFIRNNDAAKTEKPVKNNELVSKNHRSGDSLPTLLVEVLDGYGQSPALGEGDTFVQATMHSPNDLFSGEINMPVNEMRKGFPPITGFQRPGRYEIQINFSESGLESLTVEVQVRDCKLGEFSQENGTLCVPCSGSQCNFDPDATTCHPCPENANCTTDVIHPNAGYWHRTPCSRHVQQCVSREACDFSGREEDLDDATREMETCELDASLDRDYSQAQCKEVSFDSDIPIAERSLPQGYTGLLCGSCDAGYGRSWSFDCGKCLHDSGTVLLLVASLFVLLILSSFAIRSNLNPGLAVRVPISRASPSTQGAVSQQSKLTTDVPVNFEMVEMLHSGHVPPEMVHPDLLATATTKSTSTTDPPATIAKRTVVEIFKAEQTSFVPSLL